MKKSHNIFFNIARFLELATERKVIKWTVHKEYCTPSFDPPA